MMVVIGIIAILSAVVVPGFKKVYSDFKIAETYNIINGLMSDMRSFYLIYNEPHRAIRWKQVEERMLPILSEDWRKYVQYLGSEEGRVFYSIRGRLSYFVDKVNGYAVGSTTPARQFSFSYFTDKPYLLEDFWNMCKRKGYIIEKHDISGTWGHIHLPERHEVEWFR